jgi:hypothetical protein
MKRTVAYTKKIVVGQERARSPTRTLIRQNEICIAASHNVFLNCKKKTPANSGNQFTKTKHERDYWAMIKTK